MKLNDSQIREAINRHLDIQTGNYLTAIVPGTHASYAYSDYITDFYWNYAIHLDAESSDQVKEMMRGTAEFLTRRGAVPCFYVDPTSKPANFADHAKDFAVSREVWMFFSGDTPNTPLPKGLRIVSVDTLDEMSQFVEVFNRAYGGESTGGEGYSGLSPAYGECLLRAFRRNRPGYSSIHYIGYLNDEPVGIASLYCDRDWGGIYNVGTVSQSRGKGVASALSAQAIKTSLKMRHERLFLQTEEGGSVEKFYARLGFSTDFVGEFYYKG